VIEESIKESPISPRAKNGKGINSEAKIPEIAETISIHLMSNDLAVTTSPA
jgi:hypothetical protein